MRREPRSRSLSDQELRLIWAATLQLGYQYGPLFQLLIVTGQRELEVADASWDEFDLASGLDDVRKSPRCLDRH